MNDCRQQVYGTRDVIEATDKFCSCDNVTRDNYKKQVRKQTASISGH